MSDANVCPSCGGPKHWRSKRCASCASHGRITTGAGLTERHVGARGEQKRRWDRENRYESCPTCDGFKTKRARVCRHCQRTGMAI